MGDKLQILQKWGTFQAHFKDIYISIKNEIEGMEIFLIDGVGPFFRNITKRKINWSKIPFHNMDRRKASLAQQFKQIAVDMETFTLRVSQEGYNSISIDDVAHLATDPWHTPEANTLIGLYQKEYKNIFSICTAHGLDIYLTLDVLSLTKELRCAIGDNKILATAFLERQIENVLQSFPEVKGVIFRIGECDGKDVKGTFQSALFLQSPQQVNLLLHRLLPIFEKNNRYLILRTWTVGAYAIGDFNWNRRTIAKALKNIVSPNFILSMKYGESDFFRYLPLNKFFFTLGVKKIIELQARREYEGCGEYPSFVGWDYSQYANQLQSAKNMVGVSVWCQTGGWVPFRRLTYLEPNGIWNELNSHVTIKIFKDQLSVEEAVTGFAHKIGCKDVDKLLLLLRLSDEVIKELLYIEEIAEKKLFFRRVRIPPLMSVMWNNIFINDSVRTVLRAFVSSGEDCIKRGQNALEKTEQMELLACELHLPAGDIRYMYDTFSLLALAREYYFTPYNEGIKARIQSAKAEYKKKYPKETRPRYRVKTNFKPFFVKQRHLQWVLGISLRKTRGYRLLDHLITLHLLGFIYRIVIRFRPSAIPKFARKQAMGIGTIFK